MPTSIFAANKACSIDASDQTFNINNVWNLGTEYLNGLKTFARRVLLQFDLNDPESGAAITGSTSIISAFMRIQPTSDNYQVPTPVVHWIERCIRDDFDPDEATWLIYKLATNWTTVGGGGDVATPPAIMVFNEPPAPAAGGPTYDILTLQSFVEYAADNTGGLVTLRLRLLDETPDDDFWWAASANIPLDTQPRLYVEIGDPDPLDADTPHGATLGSDRASPAARPQRPAGRASASTAARPARPTRRR